MDLLGSEYTEADEKAIGNDADDHSQLDTGKNKLESPLVRFLILLNIPSLQLVRYVILEWEGKTKWRIMMYLSFI